MEKKSGLKTGQAIALFAILVLNICWIIAMTVHLSQHPSLITFVVLCYIQFALAAYYACFGYKKPHGNLMRYLLLFYVATLGAMLVRKANSQGDLSNSISIAVIILSAYMAGRLNKYKQNVFISLVILVLKLINIYPTMSSRIGQTGFTFISFFGSIGPVVVWLAIAGAYILRYKDHKEAGLAGK